MGHTEKIVYSLLYTGQTVSKLKHKNEILGWMDGWMDGRTDMLKTENPFLLCRVVLEGVYKHAILNESKSLF